MISFLLALTAVLLLVLILLLTAVTLDLTWQAARHLQGSWQAARTVIEQTRRELCGADENGDTGPMALADAIRCGFCDPPQRDGTECVCSIRCPFPLCQGRTVLAAWTGHDFRWLGSHGITFEEEKQP